MTVIRKPKRHEDVLNPLDLIEEIADNNEWRQQRLSPEDLVVELDGEWGIYKMGLSWHEDINQFAISIYFDLYFGTKADKGMFELMNDINRKISIGHIEYCQDLFKPTYRYNMLVQNAGALTHDYIEDLLEKIFAECDRFHPVLSGFLYKDLSVNAAMKYAILEIHGHA